jgi:ribosomal protein L11
MWTDITQYPIFSCAVVDFEQKQQATGKLLTQKLVKKKLVTAPADYDTLVEVSIDTMQEVSREAAKEHTKEENEHFQRRILLSTSSMLFKRYLIQK